MKKAVCRDGASIQVSPKADEDLIMTCTHNRHADEDFVPDGGDGIPWQYIRMMTTQSLYRRTGLSDAPPEEQFVSHLIAKKVATLSAMPKEKPRDIVLDIELTEVTPRVWRRVKVSSGMKLNVFTDRVLLPLMGWCRHYHAYYLTDFKDGSLFGPVESGSIDMMHLTHNGVKWISDEDYTLGHLLLQSGDSIGFMYDLGDHYDHLITLIGSSLPEDSKGKVELLDGAMACPPEDGKGNATYQELLDDVLDSDGKVRTTRDARDKIREAGQAMNYETEVFNPVKFSLEGVRERVGDAIKGKGSEKHGHLFTQLWRVRWRLWRWVWRRRLWRWVWSWLIFWRDVWSGYAEGGNCQDSQRSKRRGSLWNVWHPSWAGILQRMQAGKVLLTRVPEEGMERVPQEGVLARVHGKEVIFR